MGLKTRNCVLKGLFAIGLIGPLFVGSTQASTIGALTSMNQDRLAFAQQNTETSISFDSAYVFALNGKALQYLTDYSDPSIDPGSTYLWAAIYSCLKDPPYTCSHDSGGGLVPESAFSMDLLMESATISATLSGFSEGDCEVDASFTAITLPRVSHSSYAWADPNGGIDVAAYSGPAIVRQLSGYGSICDGAWSGTFDYGELATTLTGQLGIWFNPDEI